MGFRTVVMLNNDRAHEWEHDPQLGQKIACAMNRTHSEAGSDLGYGRVVECTHADNETLAVMTHYVGFQPVGHGSWSFRHETDDEIALKLLKQAADKLGYRLVKKS